MVLHMNKKGNQSTILPLYEEIRFLYNTKMERQDLRAYTTVNRRETVLSTKHFQQQHFTVGNCVLFYLR